MVIERIRFLINTDLIKTILTAVKDELCFAILISIDLPDVSTAVVFFSKDNRFMDAISRDVSKLIPGALYRLCDLFNFFFIGCIGFRVCGCIGCCRKCECGDEEGAGFVR